MACVMMPATVRMPRSSFRSDGTPVSTTMAPVMPKVLAKPTPWRMRRRKRAPRHPENVS